MAKLEETRGLRRGVYETTYGNAAVVSGLSSRTAWDLDMGCRIPLSEVRGDKFLRAAEASDFYHEE